MNSKQRAYLRGLANDYEPVFSIGKAGITPELCDAVSDALEKRELIKVSVQKNCPGEVREYCDTLAERTKAEPVTVVGRKFVIYRRSKEKPSIELPR